MTTDNFDVSGLFYDWNNFPCRKYLNIKIKNTKLVEPDLMVIMMNPGSSKPIEEKYNIETPTKPDTTQKQIMAVMTNCQFEYARILNLSDIREPKSQLFFKTIASLENNHGHSIFSSERINDFKVLFNTQVPILLAWGVNKKLLPLAIPASKIIKDNDCFGWLKENSHLAYYHPLPRKKEKQLKWVHTITNNIKNQLK